MVVVHAVNYNIKAILKKSFRYNYLNEEFFVFLIHNFCMMSQECYKLAFSYLIKFKTKHTYYIMSVKVLHQRKCGAQDWY